MPPENWWGYSCFHGQGLIHALIDLFLGAAGLVVDLQRLGDLLAHGEHGVQGGHGVLEDHGDLVAADLAHLGLRQLHHVLSLEGDGTGRDLTGALRQQAHQRQGQRGLTGAGLAHQTQCGALLQRKAHVVDGVHRLQIGLVDDAQILDL